jgi:hypothetical protein
MIAQRLWIYPALVSVLGQNRKPSFGEMRYFVRRIRREVIAANPQTNLHRQAVRRLVAVALQRPGDRWVSKG